MVQQCIIVEFLMGHIYLMVILVKRSETDQGSGVVSGPLFVLEVVHWTFHPEYDV